MKSPGSGVIKELSAGTRLTVRDLATLCIIVSDNTATDLLMSLTDGTRTIRTTMQGLGLLRTNVVSDCRTLILTALGMDPSLRGTELLPKLRHMRPDFRTAAFKDDLEANNVTTPTDLALLFTLLQQRAVLAPDACGAMLDILGRQQLNGRMPLFLPPDTDTAHKTGTLGWTRNDAGLIYLPDGDAVAFCALSRKVPEDPYSAWEADRTIGSAARIVFDHFCA